MVVCVWSVCVCGGDGEEDTIEHSAEQERAYIHTQGWLASEGKGVR